MTWPRDDDLISRRGSKIQATAADEIGGMDMSMGRSEDSRHWTWIEYELQWPRATPARVPESEKYIGIERAENINEEERTPPAFGNLLFDVGGAQEIQRVGSSVEFRVGSSTSAVENPRQEECNNALIPKPRQGRDTGGMPTAAAAAPTRAATVQGEKHCSLGIPQLLWQLLILVATFATPLADFNTDGWRPSRSLILRQKTKGPTPDLPPPSPDTALLSLIHDIQTCESCDGGLKGIEPYHSASQGKRRGAKGMSVGIKG
ncbi:hypothetical protein OEA41_003634 [Lepraria neglecta]|uniref:Uncharacterized protein n=1 Tax=Lepraria neglecta TaxID=209136 RepID=A0AAE0DJF5_9LECA|nr:hypothetical protein OEA41_003634 [Lepraria neglecta]